MLFIQACQLQRNLIPILLITRLSVCRIGEYPDEDGQIDTTLSLTLRSFSRTAKLFTSLTERGMLVNTATRRQSSF